MIRLKHLLLEQPSTNKPKVLFVGDKQTLTRGSYASNLINSELVSGKIVGQPNANATDLYKILRKNINDTYDVVIIQLGPDQIIGTSARTVTNSMRILDGIVRLANSKGAKTIVISVPSTNAKTKLTPEDIISVTNKINSNTIANDVISVNASAAEMNQKTGIFNSAIQQDIQDNVIESVNELSKINISTTSPEPDTDTDLDSPPASGAADPEVELVDLGPVPANAADFINMWKDTAISEMNRTGIPASITLAQAGIESAWGKSRLARKGNNFFGIKCHSWSGDTIYASDDRPNECFRKYKNAADSFKDHSEFLVKNSRYSDLFNLGKSDYVGWSKGLRAAGYATSPTYASALINTIKSYGLDKYDSEIA